MRRLSRVKPVGTLRATDRGDVVKRPALLSPFSETRCANSDSDACGVAAGFLAEGADGTPLVRARSLRDRTPGLIKFKGFRPTIDEDRLDAGCSLFTPTSQRR
jgi:hypothetical protein